VARSRSTSSRRRPTTHPTGYLAALGLGLIPPALLAGIATIVDDSAIFYVGVVLITAVAGLLGGRPWFSGAPGSSPPRITAAHVACFGAPSLIALVASVLLWE
jgi:hypothetical protein